MSDRTVNYDALLALESEARERIARAIYELGMQHTRGVYCPGDIKHILEGGRV